MDGHRNKIWQKQGFYAKQATNLPKCRYLPLHLILFHRVESYQFIHYPAQGNLADCVTPIYIRYAARHKPYFRYKYPISRHSLFSIPKHGSFVIIANQFVDLVMPVIAERRPTFRVFANGIITVVVGRSLRNFAHR